MIQFASGGPNTDTQTARHTDTQTVRHTDTPTHRHTDSQTHRHTDNQTDRPIDTDRQTNAYTYTQRPLFACHIARRVRI